MKWSKKKLQRFSCSYSKTARKKGYKAEIIYNDVYKHFYFMLEKEDYVFNSLWENMNYKTESECMTGCEKYIDLLVNGEKKNDK